MVDPETDLAPTDQPVEAAETSRDEWLELAIADPETAALATAARHGRPLPPRG
ncbi:MAG: hypothetical protein ACJ762_10795 [Solirubrobacteraceae bacterium]